MSADQIDDGCEREQRDREMCLAAVRRRAQEPEMPPTGTCYNCGDPVGEGERFCDGECLRDYERRKAAEKRRGRQQ